MYSIVILQELSQVFLCALIWDSAEECLVYFLLFFGSLLMLFLAHSTITLLYYIYLSYPLITVFAAFPFVYQLRSCFVHFANFQPKANIFLR